MKNKLLAITRSAIPYIPQLRQHAGSITAAIVWQQLDYWFSRYPDGFFKFLEPPNKASALYHPGDSWVEELCISKKEFQHAFDLIGCRFISKTTYRKAKNKYDPSEKGVVRQKLHKTATQERYFSSYKDRIKGVTYYFRNHPLADSVLNRIISDTIAPKDMDSKQLAAKTKENKGSYSKVPKGLYVSDQKYFTEVTKGTLHLKELYSETTAETTAKRSGGKQVAQKPEFLHSSTPAPFPEKPLKPPAATNGSTGSPACGRSPTEWESQLIACWNKYAPGYGLERIALRKIPRKKAEHLEAARAFEPDLAQYEAAFKNLSGQDWYLGRTEESSWKADFFWAIQPDHLTDILNGKHKCKVKRDYTGAPTPVDPDRWYKDEKLDKETGRPSKLMIHTETGEIIFKRLQREDGTWETVLDKRKKTP